MLSRANVYRIRSLLVLSFQRWIVQSWAAFTLKALPERGFDGVVDGLKRLASHRTILGDLGTGAYLMGHAGPLDGHRATTHWPYSALLAEYCRDTVVPSNVDEIGSERLTCAGGSASFDMLLA